jgi:hypothetical protein
MALHYQAKVDVGLQALYRSIAENQTSATGLQSQDGLLALPTHLPNNDDQVNNVILTITPGNDLTRPTAADYSHASPSYHACRLTKRR